MANRFFQQFRFSLEKQIVDLYFKVTIGAAGAPTLVANGSKGVKSIVRNSAGNYTVTLQDSYFKFLDLDVTTLNATGIPAAPAVGLITVGVNSVAAPTINYVMSTGGVATDPANGDTLYGKVSVTNSSAF